MPAAAAITGAPHATGSVASAQQLRSGAAVAPRWWESFGSAPLNALVAAALDKNPTIATAQATLAQAQFEVKAAHGAFFPHLDLNLGAQRTHSSGAATGGNFGSQTYNLYTGQVGVSYDLDVFGVNRLVTRAAQAQVDVAADQLDAARLTIAGKVVNVALDLAALQAEIDATHKTVHDQQRVLKLTQTQYRLGAIDQFQVFTQQSLLASTRAALSRLQQARDAARHLLATLVGQFPADAGGLATPTLGGLTLPASLPLSLPSSLVRQRPDIRAAEAQLRGANARVGEAVARLYPSLQLTANFGAQSNLTSAFFDPASRLWEIAASLAAPLFEGGTLRARKHAAQAAYRGVFATYEGTVLDAFRNVADVLRALQHDAALLEAQADARDAAQHALKLVTTEYEAGQVNFLNVLTSEVQAQNARVAYLKAAAQRYADTAALYVALGGGAWPAAAAARD